MEQHRFGRRSEAEAAAYLSTQGYRVVAANYRSRVGEIDLIAWEGDTLCFVEVKARRGRGRGTAAEAIDRRKLARLRAVAGQYLAAWNGVREPPCRFDAVLIDPPARGAPPGPRLTLIRGLC